VNDFTYSLGQCILVIDGKEIPISTVRIEVNAAPIEHTRPHSDQLRAYSASDRKYTVVVTTAEFVERRKAERRMGHPNTQANWGRRSGLDRRNA
jgi:hypothetical protein